MKDPLQQALIIQRNAKKLGFDWKTLTPVLEKLEEEIKEVSEAIEGGCEENIEEEMGDLIFQWINLCRHLNLCPTVTLLKATEKFKKRLDQVFSLGKNDLSILTEKELDDLWKKAKEIL